MINILPSKKDFIRHAAKERLFPVYAELPYMNPQSIYEVLQSPHSFLLESIKGPDKISRYSFIGLDPFLILKIKRGSCEVFSRGEQTVTSGAPLSVLKKILRSYVMESLENLPPFVGGAIGMISYDFVHYFEKLPMSAIDDLAIPDAHFLFIDYVIAIDHKDKKTFLITCPAAEKIVPDKNKDKVKWDDEYELAREKIIRLYENMKSSLSPVMHKHNSPTIPQININHEMRKDEYMNIVKKAKEYIRAGDIFQANLSQRLSAKVGDINPWNIYKILSKINPSPFAAYLNMNDYFIVSSSPERLVRVSGNTVETRPIAGTRPRGNDEETDRQMRKDLLLNEKERAEHLMLIDLERNDLGKISDYSTVEVDELMITEDYSHVIHIVSNIKGIIVDGKDCFDAIRATFPGGTITGVPKVRCMEIIDELEPVVRGPYTGSIGYISFSGNMDLNIIIRTFLIKNGTAYVQAGAGIVADSDPEKEYYETLKKAEALIKTLENI